MTYAGFDRRDADMLLSLFRMTLSIASSARRSGSCGPSSNLSC